MTGVFYTTDLKRTVKGSEEVTQRTHKLSSRQRQFLLLIDKSDALNQQICEKLSQSIDVEQLVDLGLLSTAEKVQSTQEMPVSVEAVEESHIVEKIKAVEEVDVQSDNSDDSIVVDLIQKSPTGISLNDLPKVDVIELSLGEFSAIKEIMWSALKKTNGLLAADLMMRIEKSTQPEQLKKLTARWRTTMLESKYDRAQIQDWFDEVNTRLNG